MKPGNRDLTNDILIGLPWSLAIRVPANLTGHHAEFRLFRDGVLTQSWTDATSAVVIQAYDAVALTTRILITLTPTDTLALVKTIAGFTIETATNLATDAGAVRWVEGKISVRK